MNLSTFVHSNEHYTWPVVGGVVGGGVLFGLVWFGVGGLQYDTWDWLAVGLAVCTSAITMFGFLLASLSFIATAFESGGWWVKHARGLGLVKIFTWASGFLLLQLIGGVLAIFFASQWSVVILGATSGAALLAMVSCLRIVRAVAKLMMKKEPKVHGAGRP